MSRFFIVPLFVPGDPTPVAAHRLIDERGGASLLEELDGRPALDWAPEQVPDYWHDADEDDTFLALYDLDEAVAARGWRDVLAETGEPWSSRYLRAVEDAAHRWVDEIVGFIEADKSDHLARVPIQSGLLIISIAHLNLPGEFDPFLDDYAVINQANAWPSLTRALGAVPENDFDLDVVLNG